MTKKEYQLMLQRLPLHMRDIPYELFVMPADTKYDVPQPIKQTPDLILEQIYALSERTKLPDSDLAVFLGENTHPEIKEYIKNNLLSDTHPVNVGSADLPDDVVSELSRGADESVASYTQRINQYIVNHGESLKVQASLRSNLKQDDKS